MNIHSETSATSTNIHNKTSTSSNDSFLPNKKRKVSSPSDDATNDFKLVADAVNTNPSVVRTAKRRTGLKQHKGIVRQHNGHWGAQIDLHHERIWIGTFRSEVEAARAYDSAAILIKKIDVNSHRNISSFVSIVQDEEFQKGYTTEAALNMIRDGSYPNKLREFPDNQSQIVKKVEKQSGSRTQLFRKELTPSDVGKLNRLVIPKKYALRHLPGINHDRNEREEGQIVGDVEDVEVVCYDRGMKEWNFRYCYWTSSQSFVFTRGWNRFVKEKQLKEKDVVVFYGCKSDMKTSEGKNNKFVMIDIHYSTENVSSVVPEEVTETVLESCDPKDLKTESVVSSKLEEETKSEEKKGGFMLFGVRIQ